MKKVDVGWLKKLLDKHGVVHVEVDGKYVIDINHDNFDKFLEDYKGYMKNKEKIPA